MRRLAGVVTLVLLAACGTATRPVHPDTAPPSAGPVGAKQVHADVPWRALAPTHPRIPTHHTPASPDWHLAVGAPACGAGDLRVQESGVEPAAGTAYLWVTLGLAGQRPCRVEGHPRVVLLDRGRDLAVPARAIVSHDRTFDYPHPVLVRHGVPVRVAVLWASLWCTAPVRNDRVRIAWRDAAWTVRGFGGSPACNGTPGQGPTPVDVSTFLPSDYGPGRPATAYEGVRASIRRATTLRPGLPTWYVVTVVAPRDVPLTPCPDIRVLDIGERKGVVTDREFALNCHAVPGRLLPSGKPVTFALRVGPLPHGDLPVKLLWTLEVPGPVVGAAIAPRSAR
jgi:hypothetical protein